MFRHHDLAAMEDQDEMDPLMGTKGPRKHHISELHRLTGNVGAMVVGAGLSMATMDLIKTAGVSPPIFSGRGRRGLPPKWWPTAAASSWGTPMSRGAHQYLRRHPQVRRLFLTAAVEAVQQVKVRKVPIIVRLEGTSVEQGREILAKSGLTFTVATDMLGAAKQVATLVA